jgi:outer membrane protein, multidrug efflux system
MVVFLKRMFMEGLIRYGLILFGVVVGLTHCTLFPTFGKKRWQKEVVASQKIAPEQWQGKSNHQVKISPQPWLDDFSNAALKKWCLLALENNPDLSVSAARLLQARATVVQTGSSLFPSATAALQSSRSQRPGDQRFAGLSLIANRFTAPLDVIWEVDLWGRVADERRAAVFRKNAAEYDYTSQQLVIAATSARTLITIAEQQQLLTVAEKNIQSRKLQNKALEQLHVNGIETDQTALAILQNKAEIHRTQAQLELRKQQLDANLRTMDVLLAKYPSAQEKYLSYLPAVKRQLSAGVPSELLRRRPDLLAAEARLASALHLSSASIKALFPTIRISAELGRTSQLIDDLFVPQAEMWSLAANTTQSIFQGGRLFAATRINKGRYQEQLALYRSVLLTAFSEVETAIAAEQYLYQQWQQQKQAVVLSKSALQLTQGQFEKGLVDVDAWLNAQQREFDAQLTMVTAQANYLRNRITLYLALGGPL